MSVQEVSHDAPEAYVTALWRRILRRDDIDIQESFFAQGGGSIDVVQMLAELCGHYDVDLDYRRFFEVPNIETLLHLLDEKRAS
jgi:acyl carrier protein